MHPMMGLENMIEDLWQERGVLVEQMLRRDYWGVLGHYRDFAYWRRLLANDASIMPAGGAKNRLLEDIDLLQGTLAAMVDQPLKLDTEVIDRPNSQTVIQLEEIRRLGLKAWAEKTWHVDS